MGRIIFFRSEKDATYRGNPEAARLGKRRTSTVSPSSHSEIATRVVHSERRSSARVACTLLVMRPGSSLEARTGQWRHRRRWVLARHTASLLGFVESPNFTCAADSDDTELWCSVFYSQSIPLHSGYHFDSSSKPSGRWSDGDPTDGSPRDGSPRPEGRGARVIARARRGAHETRRGATAPARADRRPCLQRQTP